MWETIENPKIPMIFRREKEGSGLRFYSDEICSIYRNAAIEIIEAWCKAISV